MKIISQCMPFRRRQTPGPNNPLPAPKKVVFSLQVCGQAGHVHRTWTTNEPHVKKDRDIP